jgi:hypothetical protein
LECWGRFYKTPFRTNTSNTFSISNFGEKKIHFKKTNKIVSEGEPLWLSG